MWSELTGLIAPHSHILPIFPDLSNVFPSLRQKKRQKIQHRISQNHSKQCLFRVIWSLNCILIGLNIVHILKCLKALQSKRTEHLVLFRYFLSNRCDTKMVGGGGGVLGNMQPSFLCATIVPEILYPNPPKEISTTYFPYNTTSQ